MKTDWMDTKHWQKLDASDDTTNNCEYNDNNQFRIGKSDADKGPGAPSTKNLLSILLIFDIHIQALVKRISRIFG